MIKQHKLLISTVGLSVAMAMSTAIVTPEPVQAFSLKKSTQKFRKSVKKTGKKIRRTIKNPKTKKVIQTIGVGLIVGGAIKGSPEAAIIGVALVAAPEVFKQDISKSYGNDLTWSSCTRCENNKPRAISVPGRTVSDAEKKASISRVEEDIKDVQRALKELGLYKKRIDGDFGPGTRAGVKEFQKSLGAPETGILSAEQRYRLFLQAEDSGYERKAVLDTIDEGSQVIAPKILPVVPAVIIPSQDVIAEYILAKSQFEGFTEEYLQSGNQAMISSANLLADGKIELTVKDAAGQSYTTVTGFINDINIKPHKLSDQWIRVFYQDGTMSEPLTLNTRDDFPSTQSASVWMTKAQNKIKLLETLTEVAPKKPEVRVADNTPSPEIEEVEADADTPVIVTTAPAVTAPQKPEITVAQAPKMDVNKSVVVSNNSEAKKTTDVEVVIAEDEITLASEEVSNTVETQANTLITPTVTNVELAAAGNSQNTLTGFDAQISTEACRQNIYVSFKFPDGEDPISHYNITPPEGTIMIDNGDSTAYFTGSCIQGNYDFSYVYIEEAKQENDWKHFEREGSFQIANNSEQCSVDLYTPEKSASMQCF